jgi:outer membrane receptor protein involved in Fe transport
MKHHSQRTRSLAVCSAGFLLAQSVFAQAKTGELVDLGLEDLLKVEVVTSASKFAQSVASAPSAVQVITAEEIRRYGWRTVAEALQSLPGLYFSTDRVYSYAGTRGFLIPGDLNTRFALLLDGQRINDNIYEQAYYGRESPIDISLISRIEYVPGPGSSVYGSNAMFGVINLITIKPGEGAKLAIEARTGSQREGHVAALAQHQFGDAGARLLLSVSRTTLGGRDVLYPDTKGVLDSMGVLSKDGVARSLDSMRGWRAFSRLSYEGLSASIWSSQSAVRPSAPVFGALFGSSQTHVEDNNQGLALEYSRALGDGLTVTGRASVQRIAYLDESPTISPADTRILSNEFARGDWASFELRGLYTSLAGHTFIAGMDGQRDLKALQVSRNTDLTSGTTTENLRINNKKQQLGLYAQDDWKIANEWTVSAGVRHDWYSARSGNTSPRVGAIWSPNESATFKLLAGRAYRSSTAYERDYAYNEYLANPNLAPETIRTVEAIGELRWDRQHKVSLSVFDYKLNNLIAQVQFENEQLQYRNQPGVGVHGVEAAYKFANASGVQIATSVGLNRVRNTEFESTNGAPSWVAKLRASAPLHSSQSAFGLTGAFEVNALGPRVFHWNQQRFELASESNVALTLTGANVLPGLDAQMRVTNALGQVRYAPASEETSVPRIPTDPRQWSLTVRYAL